MGERLGIVEWLGQSLSCRRACRMQELPAGFFNSLSIFCFQYRLAMIGLHLVGGILIEHMT